MNLWYFIFLILLFLGCQPHQSTAQGSKQIKAFDSKFGRAIADFTKKDTFLLMSQIDNVLDTIIYWAPKGSITSVWDVKLYNGKCVVIIAAYNFINIYAYKKVNKRWEYVGASPLLNDDEPHNRNEPKQTIIHKNENNVQVFQGSKLIRECIIDYDKSTCQIIEYAKE